MCITEFNEKTFVDGIRQEGRQEGRREGRQEGRREGRQEGQNVLVETITRLRNGETPEQLLASGIDQHTIDLALTIK